MSRKIIKNPLNMVPFYFLRHGQTDYNVQRLFTGQHDIPLNATGIEQAKKAARLLKNKGIQVIASSPLSRAFQTAHIVSQELQVPIVVIDDLKEANWGVLQGQSIDSNQELIEAWEMNLQLEDAELCTEFGKRIERGLVQALALTDPVLVVAHGGVYEQLGRLLNLQADTIVVKNAAPLIMHPATKTSASWFCQSLESAVLPDSLIEKQIV